MITYIDKNDNTISQNSYEKFILNLQIHQIKCPGCGHFGCMRIHGYYTRKVKTKGGSFILRVMRLVCTGCGQTHALLPSSLVPYSQPSLECQVLVIEISEAGGDLSSVCSEFPDVDENNIKSMIKKYRKCWKQKLSSEAVRFRPLEILTRKCFAYFSRKFLQIHRTVNSLFFITT